MNGNHLTLRYRHTNTKGRKIYHLIQRRTLQHIGPYFPTYLAHNTAIPPDIILTNYTTYHNTHITHGPLTTSDHIPIMLTISTNPIEVAASPRPNFAQANWENFDAEIYEAINTLPSHTPTTLEDIDTEIEHWYNTIHTAIQHNIPKTSYKTLQHPHLSHHTRMLRVQFNAIQLHAATDGWNLALYREYRTLQLNLQGRSVNENNEHWSQLTSMTAEQYEDSETIWRKIKNLMGNTNPNPHYLLDQQNNKIETLEGKERQHQEVWEEVFAGEFDVEGNESEEQAAHVKHYIQENIHRSSPDNTVNTDRLDSLTPMTVPINTHETKEIIKHMKISCLGSSEINKTIMKSLPPNAIKRITDIFNSALLASYFPDFWKTATIRLIAKVGNDPHRASADPSPY